MTARDKEDLGAISFANSDPSLRQAMPDSLKNLQPVRSAFDPVRDPFIARQLEDKDKTESQRREEGSGSTMVRNHNSFPELKPRYANVIKRQAFSQAWFKEQRAAVFRQFEQDRSYSPEPTGRVRSRGLEPSF